jgi:aryl-alcohol dehydrogenase-like predicted oxidoreductase
MEYRRLGHSGLQVSVIGLGTNNFGPRIDYPAAERVLHQAVEAGINFIGSVIQVMLQPWSGCNGI